MDMNIEDKEEGIIYTSLIMRADNPYMDKVMIEFKNIMLKAQEGDKWKIRYNNQRKWYKITPAETS